MLWSRKRHNGYVKIPKKKTYEAPVRLTFNSHTYTEGDSSKLEGFTIRLSVPSGRMGVLPQIELGLYLRPEEWLDLIDAMKRKFDAAQPRLKDSGQR